MKSTLGTVALAAGLLWASWAIQSLRADNLQLRSRVDMLEAGHSALNDQLGETEGELEAVGKQADECESDLSDLESRVGDLEP